MPALSERPIAICGMCQAALESPELPRHSGGVILNDVKDPAPRARTYAEKRSFGCGLRMTHWAVSAR